MSYKSEKRARLLAEKTTLENRLTTLNTTMDSLAGKEVEKYKYASAEGDQSATRRKFEEVQKQIDATESRLSWVCQQLANLGVVVTRLRRKKYDGFGHRGGRY